MSANFYSGYACDKPTSKVMAPPGGRSNNIFGGHEENQASLNQNKAKNASSNIFGGVEEPKQQQPQAQVNHHKMKSNIFGEITENSHKSQRKGFDPITGQSYETNAAPAQKPTEPVVESAASTTTTAQQNVSEDQNSANNGKTRAEVHTSSRVLQPPGGKSNGPLW